MSVERDVVFTLAWAECPCGETWTSDLADDPHFVIADVADECRAHMQTCESEIHPWTQFNVGIEP